MPTASADKVACMALSDCWFAIGECHADQQEHEQAIECYKKTWQWWLAAQDKVSK